MVSARVVVESQGMNKRSAGGRGQAGENGMAPRGEGRSGASTPRASRQQAEERTDPARSAGFCWTVTSPTGAAPLASTPSATKESPAQRSVADLAGGAPSPPSKPAGRRLSLLWWVFLVNAAVLFIVFLLLSFSPIEVSAPIESSQFALLLAGLAAMLVLTILLLRRVLAPFLRLTETMGAIDPDRPGRRLSGFNPRTSEGAALVDAFNAMLDRLESARREAARTALAAQEAERSRVARELHDEIGQTLTAVMLHAERAAAGDSSAAQAELVHVADAVRESLDEVRRIARELRPEALDDLGLVNALIALCSQIEDQGGTRVRRQLHGGLPPLSPEVELVIYRVAQESLTNALRHADAQVVNLSLTTDAEGVRLSVSDDGRGIAGEPTPGTAGISGMRERALLVGARLSIASGPGQGTEVVLTVPVDPEDG